MASSIFPSSVDAIPSAYSWAASSEPALKVSASLSCVASGVASPRAVRTRAASFPAAERAASFVATSSLAETSSFPVKASTARSETRYPEAVFSIEPLVTTPIPSRWATSRARFSSRFAPSSLRSFATFRAFSRR